MGWPAYNKKFEDNLDALRDVLKKAEKRGLDCVTHQTSKWFLLNWSFIEISALRKRIKELEARAL